MKNYQAVIELYDKFKFLYWQRKYTNEHLHGRNRSYQKFIVLTYQRSGSNYFLDLLRSHSRIICYNGMFGKGLSYPYTGYPPFNCKGVLEYRNKYPISFLTKMVFRNFHENIGAVGFKISYASRFADVHEYLRSMPDLKVINLRRKNLLHIYISMKIVDATDKQHAVARGNEQFVATCGNLSKARIVDNPEDAVLPEDFKITLKYEDCLQHFEKISSLITKFDTFYKPENVLVIYYEDLLANFDETTRKVLDFLGVDFKPLTSRLLKIRRKKASETITNYFELKERFALTPWAVFFDEE